MHRKANPYPNETAPEILQPGQPGYVGTYTPPAPYDKKEKGEEGADR